MQGPVAQAWSAIEEYRMIRPGESVVTGLSGGADSVCLLEVLIRLRGEGKITAPLRAVHVHHGLRASADEDERFVRDLCAERNIPLHVYHVDAAGEALRLGCGVEEAGRRLRREIYARECASSGGKCCAALAHHREDCAETMLFHLCRGSSVAGMCGIRPVSDLDSTGNRIIRPLLRVSRQEIETWLKENRLSWRNDETNGDLRYTRNYLRHEIFPRLEAHVNSAAAEHMAQTALELADAEDCLREVTEKALEECMVRRTPADLSLSVPELLRLQTFLRNRVLYLALSEASGGRTENIGAAHIRMLREMLTAQGSTGADLPGGVRAVKEYGILTFRGAQSLCGLTADRGPEAAGSGEIRPEGRQAENAESLSPKQEHDGSAPADRCRGSGKRRNSPEAAEPAGKETLPLSADGYSFRVLPYRGEPVPVGRYTKWLDYDKISRSICFRTRRAGDRIAVGTADAAGAEETGFRQEYHYKKLGRVMIDRRIPASLRDRIVLPMDGEEVLWFPGYRISAAYLVGENTLQVLELSWNGGEDGRKEDAQGGSVSGPETDCPEHGCPGTDCPDRSRPEKDSD